MRFDRFHLTRFGHFTEQFLDFPLPSEKAPDLHLVIGPNEAGKSTFRAAVGELLFGFHPRSPYTFLHRLSNHPLALGAELRHGQEVEAIERLKKTKRPLRRPEGDELADDHLATLLGGLDKRAFFRLFALDHAQMVEGGEALLRDQDDPAFSLFAAASGIADFSNRQRVLEEETSKLWSGDGRKLRSSAYAEAHRHLQDASKKKKNAVTTAPAYAKLRRAKEVAEARLKDAKEKVNDLNRQVSHLERLRRAAPLIAQLDAVNAAIRPLDEAASLPGDAGARLEEARRQDAVFRNSLNREGERCKHARQERGALEIDEKLLSEAAVIEALDKEAEVASRHRNDIPKRREEIAALEAQALEEARNIGWRCASRQALEATLPTGLVRDELEDLLNRGQAIEIERDNHRQAVEDLRQTLAEKNALLDRMKATKVDDSLRRAAAAAQALGDVPQRLEELSANADSKARALREAITVLAPWSGDLEALAVIHPPAAQEIDAADQAMTAEAEALSLQVKAVAEAARVLETKQARLAAERTQRDLVDKESLDLARAQRDTLWQQIRDGQAQPKAVAPDYEALVLETDALADRRYAEAEALTRAEQMTVEIAGLAIELKQAERERERLLENISARSAAWSQRLLSLGLPDMPPPTLRNWLAQRREALARGRDQQASYASLEHFKGQVEAAVRDLEQAQAKPHHSDPPAPLAARFGWLLHQAQQRIAEADATAARQQQNTEFIEEAKGKLAEAEGKKTVADGQWTQWHAAWVTARAACHLPATISMAATRGALKRMAKIEDHLKEIGKTERERIDTMRRDLAAFAQQATTLAQTVAPDLATKDAQEIAQTLSRRLAEAKELRSRRRAIDKNLVEIEASLQNAETGLTELHAAMAPLFADAGVLNTNDYAALTVAVQRSDERRRLENDRADLHQQLSTAAGGVPIEALREALTEIEPNEIEARLQALDLDRNDVQQQLVEAGQAVQAAQVELDAIGGEVAGSTASEAEEERQQAIARMAAIASDYIEGYLRARLLRWAIERYREENKAPLLERASPLFALLTAGHYEGLAIEDNQGEPRLVARPVSGDEKSESALSTGTRDQLYLALRLAAMELQLAKGPVLPVIADDLFVNFDDDRAAAGFQALAHLARHTQVLYLSHHDHLIAVAGKALGSAINVVKLGPSQALARSA